MQLHENAPIFIISFPVNKQLIVFFSFCFGYGYSTASEDARRPVVIGVQVSRPYLQYLGGVS